MNYCAPTLTISHFYFPIELQTCLCLNLHLWSYWIKLLLCLYQAWKHLSSKVCEILEELRAVQVCVSVWASTGVCCLQLKAQPVTYSGIGCRANKSIQKQLPANCLCAEGVQLVLLPPLTTEVFTCRRYMRRKCSFSQIKLLLVKFSFIYFLPG